MMKQAPDDEELLRPTNSSEDVPVGTRTASPMWRSFAIAIASCVLGILAGVAFHAPRPSPPRPSVPGEGGGYYTHHQFVTEYDLVTIRYETPMAFETDVRGLGVTDEEYKTCKSSILQDPNRKICTKAGFKCYMKKLKYAKDNDGDIHPKYVKEGATEVDCPQKQVPPNFLQSTSFSFDGWPDDCRKRLDEYGNKPINICYGEIKCEEESSQWSTHVARGSLEGSCQFFFDWPPPYPYNNYCGGCDQDKYRFWCAQDAPSWYGGPNPSNLTYPSSSATSTEPYEGKFCLQKAALKALSRRGWELIEPSEAFKPAWYYDYSSTYRPLHQDVYASKTFKVIKRTPAT